MIVARSSIFELDHSIQKAVSKLYLAEEGNPLIRVLAYLERLYIQERSLIRSTKEACENELFDQEGQASLIEMDGSEKRVASPSQEKEVPHVISSNTMQDMEVQCDLGSAEESPEKSRTDLKSLIDNGELDGTAEEKKKFFRTAAGLEASTKVGIWTSKQRRFSTLVC